MLLTFVILSFVVYRVTRFIVLDSLIERVRERFYLWLLSPLDPMETSEVIDVHQDEPLRKLPTWRRKLYQLFSCPFCISVWVAAGAVALHVWLVEPLPYPVWYWLGIATGGLLVYRVIDAEE